ncbi:MAG: hypothetical protein AAF628_17690 [Planctomycetota bacterium]
MVGASQPASGRFPIGFGVPALPALRGLALLLQGANFDVAAPRIELTGPAVVIEAKNKVRDTCLMH